MWYVVAVAVWIAVGFVFSWLWGTFARFSQSESDEANRSELEPEEPAQSLPSETSDPALPRRSSRSTYH